MKKTLALALVAAMTISMASMTAFAEVTYNTKSTVKEPDEVVATASFTEEELLKAGGSFAKKYIVQGGKNAKTDGIDVTGAANTGTPLGDDQVKIVDATTLQKWIEDGIVKVEDDKDTATIEFGDIGVDTLKDSPTKVFMGWEKVEKTEATAEKSKAAPYWGANGTDPTDKNKILKADSKVTLAKDGDKYVAYFNSVGKTLTDDDAITKHVEEMNKADKDAKDAADKAKDIADKLQKLDEKYGANIKGDNDFNGINKLTGEDAKIKASYGRAYKIREGMDDYFTHAASVAGAPSAWADDGVNTWVYSVAIPDGLKVTDGHTVRVEFDLELGDKADLSKFTWKVYHIEGWCKATKVKNVEIVGNKLYAWVDSCSPFVVTRGDINASAGAKDASNPSTGDFSAVPVALLAAAALGATGFVAYKKRKAE